MKTNPKLHLLLLAILCAANFARGQGTAFTYQGWLNSSGSQASGDYDLRFTIYDSSGGPTVVAEPLTNSAVGVSNGLFTVTLDFGAGVFTGPARWLDIAIRSNGVSSFTALSPRQALTPSAYAIFANTASNVVSGSVVKSLNSLKDNVTLAAGANVTVTPSGNTLTIASTGVGGSGIWSLNGANTYYNAGNVGIGTTNPFSRLAVQTVSGNYGFTHTDGAITIGSYVGSSSSGAVGGWLGTYSAHPLYFFVNNGQPSLTIGLGGVTTMTPLGGYGSTYFGTPNGESGMSIAGANRADVRFDGYSAKLVAGFGSGPPPSENGIGVNTSGKVAIGTPFYDELLTVGGAAPADTKIEIDSGGNTYAALREVNSAGSWLWQVTPSNDLPGGRMRLTDETSGTESLSITHGGNVGVGTPAPAHRLSLIGGPFWTANSWIGALELGNASAIGWRANAGGQRFGIGQSTGGLYFFRTASDPGTTGSPATYDLEITDSGNLSQARDKGGAVKAMIYVNADGTIRRCYNAIANSSTGNCGFSVTRPIVSNHQVYRIDFGFQVSDRFFSVTTHVFGANVGVNSYTGFGTPNQLDVDPFLTDVDYVDSAADAPFTVIVY